ncbi:AT-hook motif nuclear-localized protein 9-like [Hordeum vulgare subsp. vulgare]|uniref:AT-hook motif nuclear-localized protein n=1 Tax=Hordeum vulgare subsp. vulgare TaxID=112509 RepID=A0A8I6Z800_HORVV|nr:AT-hook motif nuclear-localized protein 9-like [Hordeum vulgare subsp. vulgare]
MDSTDSSSLAASSGAASPYYVHHRPSPSPSTAAFPSPPPPPPPPPPDAYHQHPLDVFSFPMGPDPHIPHAPATATASQDDLGRKKRGRPRKYKPDGSGLIPTAPSPCTAIVPVTPGSGGGPSSEKRRGRPPGSGKMQQLASLGKSFLGTVGTGFTPHVIIIPSGEDVAARIMSFSQQGPRAVCIMSASGAVSTATLHQDAGSGSVVKYEGRFEILCLSGSYLVIDDGVSRTRNGGLCIALCGADHRVIGGSVGGVLTAAGTVQVIVGSFMYAGSKKSRKGKAGQEAATGEEEQTGDANGGRGGGGVGGEAEEEAPSPLMPMPRGEEELPSDAMMGGWAGMMRQMESRSCGIDINSIRE